MSDLETRKLERLAVTGDPKALRRLRQARWRIGSSKNYGISEGVDTRNGRAVFHKTSCQSYRIYPPPPGFWETGLNIAVRDSGDPERDEERRIQATRSMLDGDEFVACRHPDCWICLGQVVLPDHGWLKGRDCGGGRLGMLKGEDLMLLVLRCRHLRTFSPSIEKD